MSQQDMDQPAVPRVAWDSDGCAWDEIIAGNGEPTAVFKYRSDDGEGDELTLGQIDEMYGLESLDSGERDRVEASRRDWAAEAERIDPPLATEDEVADIVAEFGNLNTFLTEQVTEKLFEFYDIHPKSARRAEPPGRYVCACLTAEQAAVVLAGGFSLPLCAVHPEARA